ncbi:MAG: hypothetical protein L0Y73_02475, partial [Candidatus Aminicenantes bacterium]|nr:hypothetical protein [Candidatus Aminicenantes bacterium]
MYLKDLLKKEGIFKNPVYKLIAKIIILFLIVFAFDILVNRLTLSFTRETLFESRRLAVENIEKNKKTPRKSTAHFVFSERGQQDKIPYSLELELNSEAGDLKLEISLNESIIAKNNIRQKGKAVLNIPFDNSLLQGANTIRIKSSSMHWNLHKMSLVREKKMVSGMIESEFRLPNFKRGSHNAYRLEIKSTNRLTPLDLEVSLNGSAIQKFSIKSIGQSKLVLPIHNKILGERNILQVRSGHNEWRIDRLDIIEDYGFSRGLFYGAVVKKDSAPTVSDWKKSFPSYNKFILLLLLWCLVLLLLIPRKSVQKKQSFSSLESDLKDPGPSWAVGAAHLLFFPKCASGISRENNPRSKIETRVKQSLLAGWSIFILASMAVPLFSDYKSVYSLETIIFLLFVPLALLVYHKRSFMLRKKIVIPVVICAAFLASSLWEVNRNFHQRNFSGLIRIQASKITEVHRERLGIPVENLVMRERGYDGQYFYWVSFDPFLKK